jgi:hypothetical protein
MLGFAATPIAAAEIIVDPTIEAVARASMLQPGDVAWLTTGTGVEPSSGDNLPGFTENGGLRGFAQTWHSDRGSVYDFRWQFPDDDSALAFLDEAEAMLGEMNAGAVRKDPPLTPLPDTRYYVYSGFGWGHNYLMRDENIVAKVYIGGMAPIAEETTSRVAEFAAARMAAALGGEQLQSPPPPAAPQLLRQIPALLKATCEARGVADELERLTCAMPSDPAAVDYFLYGSAEDLDGALAWERDFNAGIGSVSDTGTCEGGGYVGTWPEDGPAQGALLCYTNGRSQAVITWSHDALRIMGNIRVQNADFETAYTLWRNAGPQNFSVE